MAFVNLGTHPVPNVEQYMEGSVFTYSIPLPVKGADLQSVFLGLVTPDEAAAEMEARRLRFNAQQTADVMAPAQWVNVGYVQDIDGVTAYFQYLLPGWEFDPTVWSNFPYTPEQWDSVP